MIHGSQEFMLQHLLDVESIVLVLLEAIVDEVLEVGRPAVPVDLAMVLVLNGVNEVSSLERSEGRLSSGQLKGVATIAPNVNLLAVKLASVDLGSNPVESTALCLPLRILVAEKGAEAEVRKLDLSIGTAEDVVTLDVTMQDVLGVHGVDGQGNVIECVLDELFRVLSLRAVFENDLFLASQIHVVHEHPDAPLELKKFDDLYDKVTVDE